jgi:hypothetical protein
VSGSTATLWRQLHESGAPLSLVLYSSPAALDDVLETVQLVAPDGMKLLRTRDVEDAFARPDVPLLLTPDQEALAVATLDGRREALLERTATAILFLLKDGSGERELKGRAFGLASWLQGREFDPEPAEIDVAHERARFAEVTGRLPDAWLAAWGLGEIPDTLENSFLYQRALLLGDA